MYTPTLIERKLQNTRVSVCRGGEGGFLLGTPTFLRADSFSTMAEITKTTGLNLSW